MILLENILNIEATVRRAPDRAEQGSHADPDGRLARRRRRARPAERRAAPLYPWRPCVARYQAYRSAALTSASAAP